MCVSAGVECVVCKCCRQKKDNIRSGRSRWCESQQWPFGLSKLLWYFVHFSILFMTTKVDAVKEPGGLAVIGM